MKLIFGLLGAVMVTVFLASFVLKVRESAMIIVTLIGIGMMLLDVWQARNEKDV